MEAPAHITLRDDLAGAFQFGLVQGDIDARVRFADGVTRVEFSWSGVDENDPVSGRGWLDGVHGWTDAERAIDSVAGRIVAGWVET